MWSVDRLQNTDRICAGMPLSALRIRESGSSVANHLLSCFCGIDGSSCTGGDADGFQ